MYWMMMIKYFITWLLIKLITQVLPIIKSRSVWPSFAMPGSRAWRSTRPCIFAGWLESHLPLQDTGVAMAQKMSFHEHLENPGQSFLCQVAGNRRKQGFFGQWSLNISRTRFYLSAKPPPLDRVQLRRPCVSDLPGLWDVCRRGHRSRELDYECFWLRRSLIKRFNFKS